MIRRPSLIPLLILVQVVVACAGPPPASTSTPQRRDPTPTPFQAAPPTPTPGPIQVWISPALPEALRQSAAGLTNAGGREVVAVEAADQADVRLEAGAQVPVTRWIYALAASFPTVTNEIDESRLRQIWAGEGAVDLLAAGEDVAGLEAHLGPGEGVESVSQVDLLDRTWSNDGVWAVVPFGDLEPRWKVLRVDGQSPIDRDFDPTAYPLAVSFGASGDAPMAQAVAQQLDWPSTNRDPNLLSVVAVTGVTALTRATAWAIERQGVDWAVSGIEPWFDESDIVHVSHEVSFALDCPPVSPSRDIMKFCGQPEQIEVLERIGTDVVELTGNHVLDWGPEAFAYTLDEYRSRGWATFGGGSNLEEAWRPALVEHNGNRVAFIGCNAAGPGFAWATSEGPGATPCDMERLHAEIARLRSEGYLPIVTFQWAESYRRWPLPPQAEAFRAAAEAGAVIVSGSQAHQSQGFEFLEGSFIHYGPGNLFFDQMWSTETRQEFIDRHVFYAGQHISTDLRTAFLEGYARPRPMTDVERAEFLREVFSASGW